MTSAVVKTVDIGGRTYSLVAKFGTMRLAEPELGTTIPSMMQDVSTIGFDAISALFWAFLQPNHPMTRQSSDDLIDDHGYEAATVLIGELLIDYFIPNDDPAPDEEAGNVKMKVGEAS